MTEGQDEEVAATCFRPFAARLQRLFCRLRKTQQLPAKLQAPQRFCSEARQALDCKFTCHPECHALIQLDCSQQERPVWDRASRETILGPASSQLQHGYENALDIQDCVLWVPGPPFCAVCWVLVPSAHAQCVTQLVPLVFLPFLGVLHPAAGHSLWYPSLQELPVLPDNLENYEKSQSFPGPGRVTNRFFHQTRVHQEQRSHLPPMLGAESEQVNSEPGPDPEQEVGTQAPASGLDGATCVTSQVPPTPLNSRQSCQRAPGPVLLQPDPLATARMRATNVCKPAEEPRRPPTLQEVRQKIDSYNSREKNCLSMKLSEDGTYTGFIKVHLKLRRPVTVPAGIRPLSIYDAIKEVNLAATTDKRTSFYLPLDAIKQLHISSTTTVSEVIQGLLKKFMVVDNPQKFALFKRIHKDGQVLFQKLSVADCPLYLRLLAGPDTDVLSFVLKENETGEVEWDAFSIPELQNFLTILEKEEQDKLQQVRNKYTEFRQKLEEALRESQGKPG
ncbi:Ras association domain-containing protein 5 [Heterocephalus glaber]|uniref:Ras association domain-containing protein 5 n=1 Tax=Heterocephalus glaber TaxID=10181 RepID=G5BP25_HETGA|nr:Ras association domain-containing protein 5 [Heterocephalus glaber]